MALLTLLQESKVFGDFYVPRFEIRVSGVGLPATVLRDVIKVTYSDDIKKLDNFELTVNNWDATTREFKYVGAETLASLGIKSDPTQKQKINPLHRIFEPTSNKVEVFLGYGGTLKLMLSGIFTTIEPNFPSSSASTLTVRGLNVLHALSLAGGLTPFAAEDNIKVVRKQRGRDLVFPFNYSEIRKGNHLEQNITLKGGDVVVVP